MILSLFTTILGFYTLLRVDADFWSCHTEKDKIINMALLASVMLFTGMNGAIVMIYLLTN